MDCSYILNILVILVILHIKGSESRPKRNLSQPTRHTKKAKLAHDGDRTDTFVRPKIQELGIRPKRAITDTESQSRVRPKRGANNKEAITNDITLLIREINRPKRQADFLKSKEHNNKINAEESTRHSLSIRDNEKLAALKRDVGNTKDERLNAVTRTLLEIICSRGKHTSNKMITLCLRSERMTEKAWGNPALPPYV